MTNELTSSPIIESQDSEINVPELVHQIRESMHFRKQTDLGFYTVTFAEDRFAIREALAKLKLKLEHRGNSQAGPGVRGKLIFFAKRIVRKLNQDHLQQEKEALDATVQLVERLLPYLDQQTQQIANCLNRLSQLEKINSIDSLK